MEKNLVYGLVLAGGKSTRMGTDKGAIVYHDIPQREYVYRLLDRICDRTFYSIREDQYSEIPNNKDVIIDNNKYRGPFNGMLSAHDKFPEVAWMVMACDLPFMNFETLQHLMDRRDKNYVATAYATNKSGLPEPLAAIWEPKGLAKSKKYLDEGTSTCPRKFLINSDARLVFPENDLVLLNANSKEEYRQALLKLIPE